MKNQRKLSRRDFIQRSSLGALSASALPSFLSQTLLQLQAHGAHHEVHTDDKPLVIVVELAGGNDFLNTVIPYNNNIYHNERPTLGLNTDHGILTVLEKAPNVSGGTEDIAFNPSLVNLHKLWQDGELAIVNGVGYDVPNLSHFTSFDYWHTAQPNEVGKDGWLGRYFRHQCESCSSTYAIYFDSSPTLAMHTETGGKSVSVAAPDDLQWTDMQSELKPVSLENTYRQLIGIDHPVDSGINGTNDVLAYVQKSAQNALISSKGMIQALANSAVDFPLSGVTFPTSRLGTDFKDTAALIHGGLDTSIYYVQQGGYDTHNGQINAGDPLTGRHTDLLNDLDSSLGAFITEIKQQPGVWERTLIFTFSEFGRKVIQNGSNGTDHGAGSSLFVTGGGVQPGFFGKYPDLSSSERIKNDSVKFNVDFRRVYRTVLQRWLGVPDSALGNLFPSQPANFELLDFIL